MTNTEKDMTESSGIKRLKTKIEDVINPYELDELKRLREYYESPDNLLHFGRDILGYDKLYDPVHKPIADMAEKYRSALFLIPRGHLKSTLLTITKTIQTVLRCPETRVWITNAVLDQSIKFMREIKDQFKNNETLKLLWSHVLYDDPEKEAEKWTETEIILKRKTRSKEATITVGSVGKETTGSHYDLHIYDDIVNMDNTETPEQMAKTMAWYRTSLSLLEPDGKKWIIGTRYDYSDLYGSLLKTPIARIVRKCVENGRPILPNRFTLEILEEIKKEQGSYIFSCQYENDPVDAETAPFKRKYLQYWDRLPNLLNVYVLVDLAVSNRDSACETAIEVCGYAKDGSLYVIEDCSGTFSPLETIKHLYRIDEQYKHPPIGVEKQQLEKALKYWMNEVGRDKGRWLNYYTLKPDMDKTRRILVSLQPLWENYKIFIKRDMVELEQQFLRFPKYNMKDRIDALAYIGQLATRPNLVKKIIKFVTDYGRITEIIDGKIIKHAWKPFKRKDGDGTSWLTF